MAQNVQRTIIAHAVATDPYDKEHFRKALAKIPANSPWESEAYFQLGQAELLTGSKPAALAAFKKYMDLAPADAPSRPEAERQIQRLSLK